MAELVTRRAYLLAVVRAEGRPVTTAQAEQLLDGSPLPPAGRNTVRKALRGLARAGHLTPIQLDGRRAYDTTSTQHTGDR